MKIKNLRELLKKFEKNIIFNADLKKKNWFNIGGKAKVFYKVTEYGYLGLGSLWGVRFLVFASSYFVFPFLTYWFLNEGLTIKSTQVITLFVTIIVVSILFWFLNKTKTGKSMRAYSDNEDLALLSGIDPKKVVLITWIIAGILATIGGVLYGLDKSYRPFVYFNNMLPIFAAAIVGGIGNPYGAFLGGYVIAFAEIFLTYAYKKFFAYILPETLEPNSLVQLLSTDYKFAISFSILVIVLLFRPSGIFEGKKI